jgi:hypothetical protein
MFVIIAGSIISGFTIHGPYASHFAAQETVDMLGNRFDGEIVSISYFSGDDRLENLTAALHRYIRHDAPNKRGALAHVATTLGLALPQEVK